MHCTYLQDPAACLPYYVSTGWCTWDSYTGQPKSDGGFWCSDPSQWCVPFQNPGDGYRMYDHVSTQLAWQAA